MIFSRAVIWRRLLGPNDGIDDDNENDDINNDIDNDNSNDNYNNNDLILFISILYLE